MASMNGAGMLGCDLLSILYNGDTRGAFMMGAEDHVVMKGIYMNVLLLSGVIKTAASNEMAHPGSWKVI